MLGEVKVPVSYNNQGVSLCCTYIVKGKRLNLLGHNCLEHLTLDWKALAASVNYVSPNKLGELLNEYADVLCDKLGALNSTMAKLLLSQILYPNSTRSVLSLLQSKKPWDKRLTT